MGCDVLHLPPIHPIGRAHRKGKNNNPVSSPDDPGSPWAIGTAEGGHESPQLGTLEEFRVSCRHIFSGGAGESGRSGILTTSFEDRAGFGDHGVKPHGLSPRGSMVSMGGHEVNQIGENHGR
jgi:hypothetical protein